eukprot:gene3348-13379_t
MKSLATTVSGSVYSSTSSYLAFAPTSSPHWREAHLPTTQQMVEDISKEAASCTFQNMHPKATQSLAALVVLESNKMELVGTQEEQETLDIICGSITMASPKQQRETRNTFAALLFFHKTKMEMANSSDELGSLLLTTDVIGTAHGLLIDSLHHGAGKTRNSLTITKKSTGVFMCTPPEQVDSELQCLVDQHNYMVEHSPLLKVPGITRVAAVFNMAAQLQLRFLTVHPFADGNGRLSRLLVNFVVQHVLPFPIRMMPPYAHRDIYISAITAARHIRDGKCVGFQSPSDLVVLIIEGAWFCMRDASNLCGHLSSTSRGSMFVGMGAVNPTRYNLLRGIGLN